MIGRPDREPRTARFFGVGIVVSLASLQIM
jgi:hypothetical protein